MYADSHDGHDDDDDDGLKSHRENLAKTVEWIFYVDWVSVCACVCMDDKPFSKIYTNLLEKEIAAGHNGDKLLNSHPILSTQM